MDQETEYSGPTSQTTHYADGGYTLLTNIKDNVCDRVDYYPGGVKQAEGRSVFPMQDGYHGWTTGSARVWFPNGSLKAMFEIDEVGNRLHREWDEEGRPRIRHACNNQTAFSGTQVFEWQEGKPIKVFMQQNGVMVYRHWNHNEDGSFEVTGHSKGKDLPVKRYDASGTLVP